MFYVGLTGTLECMMLKHTMQCSFCRVIPYCIFSTPWMSSDFIVATVWVYVEMKILRCSESNMLYAWKTTKPVGPTYDTF